MATITTIPSPAASTVPDPRSGERVGRPSDPDSADAQSASPVQVPRLRTTRFRILRFRSPPFLIPRFGIPGPDPLSGHEAEASGRCSRAGAGHGADRRMPADSAVSPRAMARADRVQGTIDPTGPETLPETVTLSHSPSATIDDDAEAPASCRTIPSTAPASSPRASALAPALCRFFEPQLGNPGR